MTFRAEGRRGTGVTDAVTLGRVMDELGATVLDVVYGKVDPRRPVSTAVIVDPLDEHPAVPPHSIALGVGVTGTDAILDFLEVLAEHQCVGLVLREPVAFDVTVARAAAASGVVIFELVHGVGWGQVDALLLRLLGQLPELGLHDAEIAGVAAGDSSLQEVADAISVLLDAPITIEDLNSRIVAFSSDQERADDARKSSVLGQQVPTAYIDALRRLGAFKRVYSSPEPVYIDDLGLPGKPRMAIRVAAGDEVLGSVWAVVDGPLNRERTHAFAQAARLVALYLLRGRMEMNSGRRARQHLLTSLLAGGENARSAARRAGIDVGRLCVIAADDSATEGASDRADRDSRLWNIAAAMQLQFQSAHPGSVCGVVGGVVYGVLPLHPGLEDPRRYVASLARDFHDRAAGRGPVLVAGGTLTEDAGDLAASRRDADRALRVIRSPRTAHGRTVVMADEVQVDIVLLEVHDRIVREQRVMTGPVPDLLAFDQAHNTDFIQTLEAFLESFGDIAQAAARLHVHPNTCRYRLRRIAEISGIDFDDPDARFSAMLQLRVLR